MLGHIYMQYITHTISIYICILPFCTTWQVLIEPLLLDLLMLYHKVKTHSQGLWQVSRVFRICKASSFLESRVDVPNLQQNTLHFDILDKLLRLKIVAITPCMPGSFF